MEIEKDQLPKAEKVRFVGQGQPKSIDRSSEENKIKRVSLVCVIVHHMHYADACSQGVNY